MSRLRGCLKDEIVDLRIITDENVGDGGIPSGRLLVDFAEAVINGDNAAIQGVRDRMLETLSAEAVVDAAGVVATFDAIDRVADGTGVEQHQIVLDATADVRNELGIDEFATA